MEDGEQAPQRFRLKTEAARERDVFRHLHPWTQEHKCDALHRNAFPAGGGGSGAEAGEQIRAAAEPCPDTAVVALAQLVALRLRARRCFVTLVSSSVEYVLSEATRTSSLQYNAVEDARDKPWLGTCSFLREEGMTSTAIDGWRRARSGREEPLDPEEFYYTDGLSPHYHIVSDIRREDQYAQRGFIRQSPKPGVRFYAAIPLRASTGSVLGSLAIVDDAPRFGLSAGELAFMEDVADTISQHLDAVVARVQRQRSERLIQSLGLFNRGKSSLREWWLGKEDSRLATAGRHVKRRTNEQRKAAGDEEFGVHGSSSSSTAARKTHDEVASASESDDSDRGEDDPVVSTAATLRNGVAGRARDNANVSTHDFGPATQSPSFTPKPLLKPANLTKAPRRTQTCSTMDDGNFDLETACKRTYARASHLMRQALDADGVVFTNVNIAQTKKRGNASSSKQGSTDTSEKIDQPGVLSDQDHDTSDGSAADIDKNCLIEAFSTKDASSLKERSSIFRFDLSESWLAQLIRRHPNGKIWNFSPDGSCYSSSGEDTAASASGSNSKISIKKTRDGRRLGKVMPGAKTIAFFPIWDESQDRWVSGLFVWSTSPHKYFDPSEDITYLASWSHSILAELARLQTMASDKAKGSFISSISHELRSPLHGILAGVEFMEETELTAFQQEMSHTIRTAGKALLDTVDNILDYAKISSFTRAQTRQRIGADALRYSKGVTNNADTSEEIGVTATVDLALLTEEVVETAVNAHRFSKTRMASADVPSVAINIERRDNWNVEIQPGSWTRILNNLVGNCLKYTSSGLISIRLELKDPAPQTVGLQNIRLTVQDTGIGMTQQFLARELYTPFKQADSHAAGTGLGLSIVRRICKDSGANLDITSELGVGTRAVVNIRARFVDDPATPPFRGLNVGRFHWFSSNIPSPSSRSIAPTVIETAQDWLDCEMTQGPVCSDDSGSVVYAIAEEDLSTWVEQQTSQTTTSGTKPSHVLVMGQSMRSVSFEAPAESLPFTPIFIHQPVGPRKLLRAITADQSSTEMGHVRPKREQPALQEYDITLTGPPSGLDRPPAGYFPWDKQAKEPRLEKATSASSTQRSTVSSAVSSMTSPSVLYSPSNSVGSTAWQESVDEHSPTLRDTALLVEDNEVNMKLLVALMRKLNYKFLCATNGREALDIYREQPLSILVILMDISMPIMTGDVATAKIRETERRRRLPRVHIAALTGVTSERAKEVVLGSGVDEFYSKPVRMKEVRELMGKLHVGGESG